MRGDSWMVSLMQELVKRVKMNSSSLVKSALKPRNLSNSPRRSMSSPKRDRRVSNKPFSISENVVSTGGNILQVTIPVARQSCLCSPTTHPGSFRCRLHRTPSGQGNLSPSAVKPPVTEVSPNRSPTGVPVMLNTLIKRPFWIRRAILSPSDPSKCRTSRKFEARPSRLSRVVMAEDLGKGVFSSSGNATSFLSDEKPLALLNIAAEIPV